MRSGAGWSRSRPISSPLQSSMRSRSAGSCPLLSADRRRLDPGAGGGARAGPRRVGPDRPVVQCRGTAGTFNHAVLDDCSTDGIHPAKSHWARRLDTPPFLAYPLRPGITFTYLGVAVNERAQIVLQDGRRFEKCSPPARSCRATSWVRDTSPASAWRSARCSDASPAKRRLDMHAGDAATIPLTLVQDGERGDAHLQRVPVLRRVLRRLPGHRAAARVRRGRSRLLANLCHNCGECLYSCQYAPPHEFAVNVPRLLSTIRQETFRKYAWPGIFAGLFTRNGLVLFASAVGVPHCGSWPSLSSLNRGTWSRRIPIRTARSTAWCRTGSWPARSA